ncbi:hypothetical protein FACS1894156_3220 [Bacteroidia bacterium]|nr:hypothetical protein FACS1894156_3220 [Bacteroidia bacterium]
MRYFLSKSSREEADLQAMMMQRIDEVFPQIEQILSVGLEMKQVIVGDDPVVIAEITRQQSEDDKVKQVVIEHSKKETEIIENNNDDEVFSSKNKGFVSVD